MESGSLPKLLAVSPILGKCVLLWRPDLQIRFRHFNLSIYPQCVHRWHVDKDDRYCVMTVVCFLISKSELTANKRRMTKSIGDKQKLRQSSWTFLTLQGRSFYDVKKNHIKCSSHQGLLLLWPLIQMKSAKLTPKQPNWGKFKAVKEKKDFQTVKYCC